MVFELPIDFMSDSFSNDATGVLSRPQAIVHKDLPVLFRNIRQTISEPLGNTDLDGELTAPYDEFIPFIKKIEKQRERIAGQLLEKAEAEKLRREFSANVSHELKTPLTSIYAGAEMLYNGIVKENDKLTFYGQIKNEAGRLITLIEDILMISKLDESGGEQCHGKGFR